MFKRTIYTRTVLLATLLALFTASVPSNLTVVSSGASGNPNRKKEDALPLRVLFQGGDVSGNATKVLLVLHQIEPLILKTHTVEKGETIPHIFAERLDLPRPTLLSLDLAGQINRKDYRNAPPAAGENVLYPDVELNSIEVSSSFNPAVESDRAELSQAKRLWAGYIKKEKTEDDKVELELESFVLKVPRGTPEKLNHSIDALTKLLNAGIRVESSRVLTGKPDFSFAVRLQGRDVFAHAERLVKLLLDTEVIKLRKHTVREGETLDSIYKEQLGLSGSFSKLALGINKAVHRGFDPGKLRVGDEVFVPEVKFQTFKWTKRIHTGSAEGQQELAELQSPAWKHLLPQVIATPSPDAMNVVLLGYELSLDAGTQDKLKAIYKVLSANPAKDIRLSFSSLHSAEKVLYSMEDTLSGDAFWGQCCTLPFAKMRRGVQGYIGSFIGMSVDDAASAAGRCAGNKCPQIVLIDENIKPHPDISDALINAQGSSITLPPLVDKRDDTQTISGDTYAEKTDHGTHLAGIIASKDNGFGLVGVNPYAKIFPVELNKFEEDHFAFQDLINDRAIGPFQIYVFASEWPNDNKQENRPGRDRAQVIKEARPLFIAAAGHKEGAEAGISIDGGSGVAPMNLGMEPNVVIVTGCLVCSKKNGQRPRLDPRANVSDGTDKYVHIAAPMQPIPSTLSSGKYGVGGGTSQAAALVGGVASLMASGFPDYYVQSPWKIKSRLLITSLPELPLEDARRLATGILDPSKALLNPEVHYLAGSDGILKEFKPANWCVPGIKLRTTGAAAETIPVEQIHRLYQTQGGEWVIYYSKEPHYKAIVRKAGPGIISAQNLSLLAGPGGEVIKLEEVADLLLAGIKRPTVGPCSQ